MYTSVSPFEYHIADQALVRDADKLELALMQGVELCSCAL